MERSDLIVPLLAILAALLAASSLVGRALAPEDPPASIPTTPDPGGIHLQVTLWPSGPDGAHRRWDVRCPSAHPACSMAIIDALAEHTGPCRAPALAGDGEAVIIGWIEGRHIAEFLEQRTRCDLVRWRRAAALLLPPR